MITTRRLVLSPKEAGYWFQAKIGIRELRFLEREICPFQNTDSAASA